MPDYQISASVTAQVQNFQQGMNAVVTSSNNAQRAVNNAGTAVRNNNQNYMNFGRVIQDLPYGINGIANNLTQLIPASGLLGVAFSALITAVTFANIGFGAWTRGLSLTNKALENLKKSGDDYLNTLDQLTQSQLKGAQNAQKDVTDLKILYGITQNTTISIKQRKAAVDELQDQYPSYFKNIKDETILNGGAADQYRELTKVIIASAKARASADLIAANSNRNSETEQKINALQVQRQKIVDAEVKRLKEGADYVNSQYTDQQKQFRISEKALATQIASITQRQDIKSLDEEIINLSTDQQKVLAKNLALEKEITKEVQKGAVFGGKVGELPDRPKMEYNKLQGKAGGMKDFIDPTFAYRQEAGMRATLDVLNKYQSGVEQFSQNLSASQERAITASLDFNSKFQESLEALGNSSITEGISTGFSSIGAAIVEGSNVFEAAGQALLGTISGFLGELGQMLVKKGIASIAAGVALNILLPGSGSRNIIGGAALVAAGAALSVGSGAIGSVGKGRKGSNGSPITAFATGGIVSGPTNALVGEYAGAKNNPEVIAPLNKLKSMLGNQEPFFQVIPIFDNKGLSIAVQRGNNQRGRV